MENTLTDTLTEDTAAIVQQIKRIIVEELQVNVIAEQIPDDYSLLEDGLALDSILIAQLIALIETQFGLQFDDSALDMELFDNVSALAAFVVRMRQAAACPADASVPGQVTH